VPQTPAQKAAAERNLRKGNPRAFSRESPQEAPPEKPPAKAQGGPGPARETIRVRKGSPPKGSSAQKAQKSPKARRVPPRAPAEDPPARSQGGGGFFDGLLKGFGGG
jgi:hypothetical protein